VIRAIGGFGERLVEREPGCAQSEPEAVSQICAGERRMCINAFLNCQKLGSHVVDGGRNRPLVRLGRKQHVQPRARSRRAAVSVIRRSSSSVRTTGPRSGRCGVAGSTKVLAWHRRSAATSGAATEAMYAASAALNGPLVLLRHTSRNPQQPNWSANTAEATSPIPYEHIAPHQGSCSVLLRRRRSSLRQVSSPVAGPSSD
jgi:hypothetical protein